MDSFRWLSIVLVVALLLAGPLAPVAWAQQSPQKAPESTAGESDVPYDVGAVAVNVIHVPGKLVLCTLGGVAGLVALALTFGSGYRAAARVVEEGCGGPWAITGKDLKRALVEPEEESRRMY